MRRRTTGAVLANPVLVGAVTVLVVVVAVFLAYNANSGLPFVPTFELRANTPNGAQLVAGNEVREGGSRIGVVSEIRPIRRQDGSAGAELTLKLDQNAAPVPADTIVRIRPRSALGLKYVEVQRGDAADTLADGATITVGEEALAPELQEFFNIFDEETRQNTQDALIGFGNAFAFRGMDINEAIDSFPPFLDALKPVMDELAQDDTELVRFFAELGDAARITAPIADVAADGFRAGAQTFNALNRNPQALKETISESPATLAVGTSALRNSRPFLRSLAAVSDDLRGAAAEVRASTPTINTTLRAGVEPLRQLPEVNERLEDTFRSVTFLARSPGSDMAVAALDDLMARLNPILRFLGPHQTVCNYWNYSWTYLADHITDTDQTGQVQRIRVKEADPARGGLGRYGQSDPVPGLHAQINGAAVSPDGRADCETGQRGFPRHLAEGVDDARELAGDSVTPGLQGPTFKGRDRVPEGQTFSSIPEGTPNVRESEVEAVPTP